MNGKQIVALATTALLVVPLIGCTPAAFPNRDHNNRPHVQGIQKHEATYVSRPDIAERVMDTVPRVYSAIVLVKNRTAYVAINQGTNAGTRTGTTGNGVYDNWTTGGTSGRPGHGTVGVSPDNRTTGETTGSNVIGGNELGQRVIDVVKQVDPSITDVHVSNDPILVTRFQSYTSNRIGARSDAGINELGDVIRRVFPTSK